MRMDSGQALIRRPIADLDAATLERVAAAWQAETPAEVLAVVLDAVADEDFARARQALATLQAHPLQPTLADWIDRRELDVAEAAVQQAWEELAERAEIATDEAAAREVSAAIEAFRRSHADSGFLAEHGDRVQEVRRSVARRAGHHPDLGLVAHWPFDDGGGRIAADVAGEHPLRLRGVRWVTGVVGGAAAFVGQAQGRADHDADFEGHRQFGIALWIRTAGRSSGSIVGKRGHFTEEDNMAWHLGMSLRGEGEERSALLYCDIAHLNHRVYCPRPVGDGRWHHVAVSFDGERPAAERLRFFIDGEAIETAAVAAEAIPRTDHPVHLGTAPGLRHYHGFMDDLRIYRRALDEGTVRALVQMGQDRD